MKRYIYMMLLGLFSCMSYSRNIDTLKVYQGTYIESCLLSNVDSLIHDGKQFVSVHHNGQISAYSVNNVDSIVIRPATGVCYQIPEEQLNGWDEGVYYMDMLNENNSFYIVSHSDPEDGTRTVYLDNSSNDDINLSIALVFNSNNEIHDIFLAGYQFGAYPKEEHVTFIVYDKDGKAIDSFDVPYEDDSDIASTRANSHRKAIEHYRIVNIRNFLGKAGKVIWNTADKGMKLEEGKYADILKDYLMGKLAGQVAKSFMGELTLAQLTDLYLKQLYENNKNWFMGSAGIEITSIKRANKSTISVEGEISNFSTIPSTRLVASEYPNYIDGKLVYMREVPNYVLYGVAEGKSGQPGLYLHDECTTPIMVLGSHFSCTLPVEYKLGQTFYFRPFLVPNAHYEESADWGQAIGNILSSNVRYGDRKEYRDFNVELSNFKQTKCVKGNTSYNVQFTIDGSIPGVYNDLSGWGICVKTPNGAEQRYYAKEGNEYYPPIEKSFTCDITIDESEITQKGGEKLAEVSIKPFYSHWNELALSFLDAQKYDITITVGLCPDSNHPHWIDLGLPSGTLWRCCNEGASMPEDYGEYYLFGQVSSAPTYAQIEELVNSCTYQFTNQKGVNGGKFTGPNGGTIFLPAAGEVHGGEVLLDVVFCGFYCSSTPFFDYPLDPYVLFFQSGEVYCWGYYGDSGLSVRPVRK